MKRTRFDEAFDVLVYLVAPWLIGLAVLIGCCLDTRR